MLKINLEGINQICRDLKSKVVNSFISNITVINRSDILLMFSFYKKEKLLISLNHQNPFLGFVDIDFSPHTELGQFNDNLRKYVKGAYINDIEVINNDRILKFRLYKTDEFFNKQTYSLILEFIPTISNLLFLNDKDEIIFAKHYADLSASRPIIKGMKYVPVEQNKVLSKGEFDYEKYQKEMRNYVLEADNKKKKEQVLPLYRFLKSKEKSLRKKIEILNKEKETANKNLIYKEYGETLLTLINEEKELNDYIKSINEIYDTSLSANENANIFFNKYKKNKRAIENLIREISIAENDLKEISETLNTFDYLAIEEIYALEEKYLPHKKSKTKKEVVDASKPYYIEVNNVKIGFGKNKEQNNYLTFKKANKSCTFVHLANVHSNHVVIFADKVNKEQLELAGEIALILAGKEDAEIQYAKIEDIKKGPEKGLVLLNKYQSFRLNKVNQSTKILLKNQKRFI